MAADMWRGKVDFRLRVDCHVSGDDTVPNLDNSEGIIEQECIGSLLSLSNQKDKILFVGTLPGWLSLMIGKVE